MDQINYSGPGELFVSNIQQARTAPKHRFDRIVTVCQDEISDNVPDNIEYSHYCMSDGRPEVEDQYGGSCEYELFARAADELYDALMDGERVLVHCHAGQSRSVSVAGAAIARIEGVPVYDSVGTVRDCRGTTTYPDETLLDHADRYVSEQQS